MKVIVEIYEPKKIEVEVDNKFSLLKEWAEDTTLQIPCPEKLHEELIKIIEDKIGCPARWNDEYAEKAIEAIYTPDMWPIAEC